MQLMHYYNMAHNHLIVAISNHSILGTWTLMSIAYLISLRLQVPRLPGLKLPTAGARATSAYVACPGGLETLQGMEARWTFNRSMEIRQKSNLFNHI